MVENSRAQVSKRRKTRVLQIAGVSIGGDNPVSVQSMTNTETADLKATLAQLKRLKKVGCELARVAVNNQAALAAMPELCRRSPLPIIADIQFDWRMAVGALEAGAAGLRLNPGNLLRPWQVKAVVEEALPRKIPIRVGVNAGSLDQKILRKFGGPTAEAMVESALSEIRLLEDLGFDLIKVSLKSSDVPETVRAYRLLAPKVDYPFHLGITEAGTRLRGAVTSALGLGILLEQGIGDTLRVSLSAPPEDEVRVGWMILSGLGLRQRGVQVIACPTCARAEFDVVKTAEAVERKLSGRDRPLRIAVMGCIVNGPGEARVSDLAAVGTKKGAQVYVRGKKVKMVSFREIVPTLVKLAEEFS
jgi:(E)-4-hydroxy-3-methylbut-2-enyl-diphosphate synthase